MKMKCAHCGQKINSKSNLCEFCGQPTYKQRRKRSTICALSVLGGICLIIAVMVVRYNLPLINNRHVLIQYMKENHPNYHIAKENVKYYYTTGGGFFPLPETVKPEAYITFDEDGFEYTVRAMGGQIISDTYAKCKLGHEVEEFLKNGFLEPRDIENIDFYFTFDLDDDELPLEWSEFDGRLGVRISVLGQGRSPQEVGWLWELYQFWRNSQHFSTGWGLSFDIYSDTEYRKRSCSIFIKDDDKFINQEAWYAERLYY